MIRRRSENTVKRSLSDPINRPFIRDYDHTMLRATGLRFPLTSSTVLDEKLFFTAILGCYPLELHRINGNSK
jgi:hypothetical protein